MGNLITHRAYDPGLELALDLSNGATSVLLSVLALAGGRLARGTWECQLMVWLATRDQAIVGGGAVGFDLGYLGWTPDGFARQRAFLLGVIDLALQPDVRERLPHPAPFVADDLARLRALVSAFAPEHLGLFAAPERDAWPHDRTELPRCAEHDVFLGWFDNCLVCNDRPPRPAAAGA